MSGPENGRAVRRAILVSLKCAGYTEFNPEISGKTRGNDLTHRGLGAAGPPDVGVACVVDGGQGRLHGEGDELIDPLVHIGRRQVDVDRHLAHEAFPHSDARSQGNLENYQS